jgi:hypothetical protein
MPDATVQVVLQGPTMLPEDRFINTLHFSKSAPGTWDGFADEIAPDIIAAWVTLGTGFLFYPNTSVARAFQLKMYNPDDPEPRQPKVYTGTLPGNNATPLPNEVAAVLSFYSTINLPRRRGRVFLGPLTTNALAADGLIPAEVRTKMLQLATDLGNAGGVDVDWQTFSRVADLRQRVTNAWVDNAWDTQRRRGLAATTRVTAVIQGGP